MILDDKDKIEYIESKFEYERLHKDDEQVKLEGLSLSGIGNCYIVIDKCGGNTPHFEIHGIDNDFKTCLKIYDPDYYFRDHTDFNKLTNDQIDELVSYMNRNVGFNLTEIEMIAGIWYGNNGSKKYDHYENPFIVATDYSLLKE